MGADENVLIPESLFLREELSINDIREVIPEGHRFPIGKLFNIFSTTICAPDSNARVNWKGLWIKGSSSFRELNEGGRRALDEWGAEGRSGLINMMRSGVLANLQSLTVEGLSDFGDEDMCHLGQSLECGHLGSLRKLHVKDILFGTVDVDPKKRKKKRVRDEAVGLKSATALASWLQSRQARALECLSITDTDLSAMALHVLVKSFQGGELHSLSELELSSLPSGKKNPEYSTVSVAEELCRSLETGRVSTLRSLALRSDSEPGDVAGPLQSLVTCPYLRGLESLSITGISHCARWGTKSWESQKISTDTTGATYSSNELQSLQVLELEGDFSDEAMITLFTSMQAGQLKTLQKLTVKDVSWMIPNKTQAMAKWLQAGKALNLRELLIHFKADGDGHQMRLADACVVGKLPKLETMDFGSPCFSEPSLLKLAQALEGGELPRLKKFVLFVGNHTRLSQDVQRAFTSAFKRNRFLTARLHDDSAESQDPSVALTVNSDFFKALRELRLLNEEQVQTLQALQDQPYVSGTYGKVFLCGNPRVGKTTLRRTLQRQPSWKSVFNYWCFEPKEEASTRGIEVDHMRILGKESNEPELELAFWDLAGQQEYEVLHSAFLPDLALADGRATFFIIVCSANADRGSSVGTARDALLYWLRFIASNSLKNIGQDLRRQVLVVLNCFGGQRTGHDLQQWNGILADCQGLFQYFLVLHTQPFILNAQREREAVRLKRHLQAVARRILKYRQVPQVCANILRSCKEWVASQTMNRYPVISWQQYNARVAGAHLPPDLLKAATVYLHEGGHLILFKDISRSDNQMQIADFGDQAVLILDPQWFCERVIGQLLLPDCLLRLGEESLPSTYMREDGSLPLALVQKNKFQISEEKCEEMVSILVRLGLGYTLSGDGRNIFVPALIRDDQLQVPEWFANTSPRCSLGESSSWVIGFSLSSRDSLRTLLPVAVLRKLQVKLAQDKHVGRRADSQFRAGVSKISCKWNGMGVLVEYYGNPNDCQLNRMDILVKPLVPHGHLSEDECRVERAKQVIRAQVIVDWTLDLAAECCPGLELKRSVIKPWTCASEYVSLRDRDVSFSVEKMTDQLRTGIAEKMGYDEDEALFATNWDVNGKLVKFRDVLGDEDWGSVAYVFEEGRKCTELVLQRLQIMERIPNMHPIEERDIGSQVCNTRRSDGGARAENDVQSLMREMHERMDRLDSSMDRLESTVQIGLERLNHMNQRLTEVLRLQVALNWQIQTLETFSIAQEHSSVPRFVYLSSKQDTKSPWPWATIQEVFTERRFLHFWCEAGSGETKMHEVEGQEGVDVSHLRDWARRLAPILIWSFKIAFVTAKVAGSALLPGFGLLLPGISNNVVQNGALMADGISDLLKLCSRTVVEDGGSHTVVPADQPAYQSKERELRGSARAYVKELLDKLSRPEFEKKVGLIKIRISDENGAMAKVVWVCKTCRKKLGHRAHEVV